MNTRRRRERQRRRPLLCHTHTHTHRAQRSHRVRSTFTSKTLPNPTFALVRTQKKPADAEAKKQVEQLLELKRAHKKAQKKKQKAREGKSLRKTKTWRPLSRTQSNVMESTASAAAGTSLDDDDDDDGDEGSLGGIERSDSMPQQVRFPPSLSSSHTHTHSLSPPPLVRSCSADPALKKGFNVLVADIPDSDVRPQSLQEDHPAHEQRRRTRQGSRELGGGSREW